MQKMTPIKDRPQKPVTTRETSELRVSVRVRTGMTAQSLCRGDEPVHTGTVKNISGGGMLIRCDESFELETYCVFHIAFPEAQYAEPLVVMGWVVHHFEGDTGVQFDEAAMGEKTVKALRMIVDEIVLSHTW